MLNLVNILPAFVQILTRLSWKHDRFSNGWQAEREEYQKKLESLSHSYRTSNVRPPARLKGERNEVEMLMTGWRATACSV